MRTSPPVDLSQVPSTYMFFYSGKNRALLIACLVALAGILVVRHSMSPSGSEGSLGGPGGVPSLTLFIPSSSAELRDLLDANGDGGGANAFAGEDCGSVLVAPGRLPDDLDSLETIEKKELFVTSLYPHIAYQNALIRRDRAMIAAARDRFRTKQFVLQDVDKSLTDLFHRYRLSSLLGDGMISLEDMERLRLRVDVIPPSLALAQAAMESGWGTSRFVREGNNLFGHWQFRGGAGMIPLERPEGETYTIARFEDLSRAVERYLLNLNTHWAYKPMRQVRAALRERRQPLSPERLVEGLAMYSSRREEYVQDILRIIRQNNLVLFDRAKLSKC